MRIVEGLTTPMPKEPLDAAFTSVQGWKEAEPHPSGSPLIICLVLTFQPVSKVTGKETSLNHSVHPPMEHRDIRQLHPARPNTGDLVFRQPRAMPSNKRIPPQHGFQSIYRWIVFGRCDLGRSGFPVEEKVVALV